MRTASAVAATRTSVRTVAVAVAAVSVLFPAQAASATGANPAGWTAQPAQAAPAAGANPVLRPAASGEDPACPFAAAPRPGSTDSPPPTPGVPAPGRTPAGEPIGGERMGSSGLVLPEGAPAVPATLSARSWVLADLDSGKVLAACAPHTQYAPASTLKLLTVLTVLPRLNPDQVITVTEEDLDFEPGSSAVGLVKGGRYTVRTLVLGLLLVSGNDAANVLARVAGGPKGVAGTLAEMNATAARLGARETHAATPSGLDGPGQWTSAYDLALIARADFARTDFRSYTATRRAQIPAQRPAATPGKTYRSFQIQNDNRLLTNYSGAIGGKTGFTDRARHTFVGAAERNGRRLVVTMLAGEHRPTRLWQQAGALLDYGFALPATTEPVGQLVAPGSVGVRPGASPPAADGALRDPVAAVGRQTGRPAQLLLGGLVGAALLLSGLLIVRRRQRVQAHAALRAEELARYWATERAEQTRRARAPWTDDHPPPPRPRDRSR